MKILFAANRLPYPPYRGDKLKIYNLARILQKNHELHLLTFLQDDEDYQYLPELEKIFKKVTLVPHYQKDSLLQTFKTIFSKEPLQVGFFKSKKMKKAIDKVLAEDEFDAVHVQHLRLAQYWFDKKNIPRILDLPDAYSLYWKRRIKSSSGLKRWFNSIEFKRVFDYEDILSEFETSLVCSREDLVYLKKEKKIENVQLLPNGVDCERFSFSGNDYAEDKKILFTGNMDYAPNVDAVVHFAEDILPIIRAAIPDVQFVIAGQRPVEKVLNLKGPGVEVTGFIQDLSQVYREAAIVVAPLRFGAGTQNKVLEAMATGIPVVSRNIGFKGLGAAQGEGIFLALEAQEFAETCIKLLQDRQLRADTGRKGQELIRKQFDWKAIAAQLENYFTEIIAKQKK